MCTLFKNILNDTPFSRKLHVEHWSLQFGDMVHFAPSALLTTPHMVPPQGTFSSAVTLTAMPGWGLWPFHCWGMSPPLLSACRVRRTCGDWRAAQHHYLYQCFPPPLKTSYQFDSHLSFSGLVAVVQHDAVPFLFLWKYWFSVATQIQCGVQNSLWQLPRDPSPLAGRGFREGGTTTLHPLRRFLVWQGVSRQPKVELLLTPRPWRIVKHQCVMTNYKGQAAFLVTKNMEIKAWHESAVSTCSPEGQLHSGLHKKRGGQEEEGRYCSPLLWPWRPHLEYCIPVQ